MTEAQAIEFIQQSSPSTGETEAKLLLQNAVSEFTILTEMLEGTDTASTQASVHYYPISVFNAALSDDDVIQIDRVDYENEAMDKLHGDISKDDLTEAS